MTQPPRSQQDAFAFQDWAWLCAVASVTRPCAHATFSAVPRIGLAIFFAFHYGIFWLVHGIFVFTLPLAPAT